VYLTLTAGLGAIFICGGIQGYQLGIGDLRKTGNLEYTLRALFLVGGVVLAMPGGGILPVSNMQMELAGAALLLPAIAVALWRVRRAVRASPGATGL
jgi:hypothetical protein